MNMDHSAWEGFEIDGHVDVVLSRGAVVVDDGEYHGRAGHGQFVKRGLSPVPASRSPGLAATKDTMDFGVVLQTNPPASRTVELARLAEEHGFSHVWTFDSHLLWQEPFVIYRRSSPRPAGSMVGPMVTNPATRDWTVMASLFATLNEMYGNRTICGIGRGDSAVRVLNGRPTKLGELREAIHVIRELANCRAVELNGVDGAVPVGARVGAGRLGRGVRTAGAQARGRGRRRLHPAARRPRHRAWMIKAVRDAAEKAGRDPDAMKFCVAAPAYIGDDGPRSAHMRDQCRWFGGMVGNHVADIVARYGERRRRCRRR